MDLHKRMLRLELTPGRLLLLGALLGYPLLANDFFLVQVGAQSLLLGLVALSLMFLAGDGGMVSLSQMSVAGLAGYGVAIFGANSAGLGPAWPWWAALSLAFVLGVGFATLIGLISQGTQGVYTIMITLAAGVAFYYFCNQNYTLFNGFTGFAGLRPPALFGLDWRAPRTFYYLSLGAAVVAYGCVAHIRGTPFGLALRAVRDNPRRMQALGFHVAAHRVAAHAIAGGLAALGGILLVWFHGRISPGSVGVGALIDVLIIAVIGGLRHPIGPFLGALVFVLVKTFAIDLIVRERFNLVIGLSFLAMVLFSPDGLLGLAQNMRTAWRKRRL